MNYRMIMVVFLFLCFNIGASENLFKNANFSVPATKPGFAAADWKCSYDKALLLKNGIQLSTSTTTPSLFLEQRIEVKPEWGTLSLSGTLDIVKQMGLNQGLFGTYPEVEFYNNNGELIDKKSFNSASARRISGKEYLLLFFTLPKNTSILKVRFVMQNTETTVKLSNLKLELRALAGENIDAPIPSGRTVDWDKEPVENKGSDRAEIVLNGLWMFQPLSAAQQNNNKPKPKGWGWINVPSSWRFNKKIPGVALNGGGGYGQQM